MPISSLPSPYGIGTLGVEARKFADFLAAGGQSCWQILPVGPTSYGDSPYQSFSSYAGNPYFIDLDDLATEWLLKPEEYRDLDWGADPKNVDYANYARAGEHLVYANPTAKETSWYEWAGVARYAARYLSERNEVSCFGAVGLRTGGEILFKVAPYAPMSCMISVCAAGWLAYQGEGRFGNDGIKTFDEERHRFIAGVESQSYAPYCACPVLLLCAVNDKKYNSDRVYDTFQQINPQTEKAILFSARGSGLMGSRSLVDLNLFLDKHLKDRWIYISKPIGISFGEDENGNLIAKGVFDADGDMQECGIFYTEEIENYRARDWTRVLATEDDVEENTFTCPINVFEGSSRVLAYSFARYTNGFSVTSKIQEFAVAKRYNNTTGKRRILYS